MYGTVAKFKAKPGHLDDIVALYDEWQNTFGQTLDGAIGAIMYSLDSDPNTLIMGAIFADKKSYFDNADNAEQDKWYRRLREHLDAEPEWMDGSIVWGRTNKAL